MADVNIFLQTLVSAPRDPPMPIEVHLEVELKLFIYLQLIHQRKLPLQNKLHLFRLEIQNINVHSFAFLDGFETFWYLEGTALYLWIQGLSSST